MTSYNPGNFANRPTGEVREIASKGGHASHGHTQNTNSHSSSVPKDELPGHGNPGNFANRPKEEVREIAAMGGHASHASHASHGSHNKSSTQTTQKAPPVGDYNLRSSEKPGHGNPGNFANRPKEEVREIAAKGGHASHSGGFASMDPERQREIASMGGVASRDSGKPGNFANRGSEEVHRIAMMGVEARQEQREREQEMGL